MAGEAIARVTGAEAGYVTSGAAAGIMLGVAACVTGLDPGRMNRLPDTEGMKDEVIIPRSHRNFYDHAIRAVGVKLVEVGISDRYSGAGVRDTEAWEISDAITERTAAVAYVMNARARPHLEDVVKAAHEQGVPVVVDAAGQLPPQSNLQRFVETGADVGLFQRWKSHSRAAEFGDSVWQERSGIGRCAAAPGPDVFHDLWNPPPSLIDKDRLPGAPQHGLGRPCKVGKEEIVGLITALRLFVAEGDRARHARWTAVIQSLAEILKALSNVRVTTSIDPGRPIPGVRLQIDEAAAGITGLELARRLIEGEPSIHCNTAEVYEGVLGFGPMCLREGDVEAIGKRLCELLA